MDKASRSETEEAEKSTEVNFLDWWLSYKAIVFSRFQSRNQSLFRGAGMYPQVATCLLLLQMLSVAMVAPVESTAVNATHLHTLDSNDETSDLYDQRQNGTENYRIHVNGVVVLVAPADAILQAAQLGTLQMGQDPEVANVTTHPGKPKPKPPTATDKVPNESHVAEIHPKDSKDKNNMKLLNLLHMFRSIRHDSDENHPDPSK